MDEIKIKKRTRVAPHIEAKLKFNEANCSADTSFCLVFISLNWGEVPASITCGEGQTLLSQGYSINTLTCNITSSVV